MKYTIIALFLIFLISSCQQTVEHRKQISLNGVWEIAKTEVTAGMPGAYTSKVRVPGLVDMSNPPVDSQDTSYANSIYWYKRMFTVDDLKSEIIHLKINKAVYHTRVYVNRKLVGENVYNFTPSVFDVKPFLSRESKENELVVAVGCRNNLPDTVANGGDFEKTKYTPGIYDDVKLTLSGYPFIANVQTAPDIENNRLRVVAEIQNRKAGRKADVHYVIREALTKKVIVQGMAEQDNATDGTPQKADFSINMEGCRLWTPESPFLYDLELTTAGDNSTTRFGMRTFAASRDSGVFLLNGRPYYLRGTNVCIFRFFEDPSRNGLPWDSKWVAKLHGRFKEMNWNGIRYCIGFPPERWYEIADSAGFLIQDEFPIWTGLKGGFEQLLKGINSKQLAAEYRDWMRERWNHPCVAVWDAQNESVNDTTGKAIRLVRSTDLSNRPWDNGYAPPVSDGDAIESHPYLFPRYWSQVPGNDGYLKELFSEVRNPRNDPNEHSPSADGKLYPNPVILNEYGWLWLNRNGSTTTLTDQIYHNVWPEANTPEKRLEVYARNLGILTEYWRSYRKAGAVFHFCGLGYSRPEKPRGQTSDNFIDLQNLVFEPHFLQYLKPAFSPVGLMAEFWEKSVTAGQHLTIPIHLINDTYDPIRDSIRLTFSYGNELAFSKAAAFTLDGLRKKVIDIPVTVPGKKGSCRMEAEIRYKGESVKSIREFSIN